MITSGYFNSSQGDRKYTAEQMSEIFDFVLNDGVLETYGEKLFVTPATSGLGVILGSGWAWFNQTWTKNDSSIPLMLDEPDPSLSRIDTVCLVVNKSQLVRANTFQVFKGLPSLSPQPATLQNTNTIIAHPLAYVTVPADASAISATNIEILVGKTACPFITSILQTTDITTLFQGWSEQYNLAYSAWNTNFNTSLAGWEADFNTWFEQLQTYLSADVVTNLQLQIDQLKTADTNNMATLRSEIATKVNTSDKATTTNAQAGTDDTKWMTPLKVKNFYDYRKATAAQVLAGTNDTNFITPKMLLQGDGCKLCVVSWTGNGTYGADNPCSITFPFTPKILCFPTVYEDYRVPNFWDLWGGNEVFKNKTGLFFGLQSNYDGAWSKISGNTITWYNTKSAAAQGNVSGATTRCWAIG